MLAVENEFVAALKVLEVITHFLHTETIQFSIPVDLWQYDFEISLSQLVVAHKELSASMQKNRFKAILINKYDLPMMSRRKTILNRCAISAIVVTTGVRLLQRQMGLKLLMPAVPLNTADLVSDTAGVCKEDVYTTIINLVYWKLFTLLLRLYMGAIRCLESLSMVESGEISTIVFFRSSLPRLSVASGDVGNFVRAASNLF